MQSQFIFDSFTGNGEKQNNLFKLKLSEMSFLYRNKLKREFKSENNNFGTETIVY